MALNGLKKEDVFIKGAKERHDSFNEINLISSKKYKRINFSLTEEISLLIDSLSLKPRDFRVSRSDVIRAAVTLLNNQNDEQIIELLRETKKTT